MVEYLQVTFCSARSISKRARAFQRRGLMDTEQDSVVHPDARQFTRFIVNAWTGNRDLGKKRQWLHVCKPETNPAGSSPSA
eukprot:4880903-Amphidinium_carterae.1